MRYLAALVLFFPLLFSIHCGPDLMQGEMTVTYVGGGKTTLTGKVVNLAGQPAPGVVVTLATYNAGAGCSSPGYQSTSATTDDKGVFTFSTDEAFSETNASLYVSQTDFAGEPDYFSLTVSSGNHYSGYQFTLHRLVPVTGTLTVAGSGDPPPIQRLSVSRGGAFQRSVDTREVDGGYAVSLKEAIEYAITPPATPNFSFDPALRTITPGPEGAAGQDFNLTRLAYSISGRVTYYSTGEPVLSRSVIITGGVTGATYTSPDGRYEFRGLGPGTYDVRLEIGGTPAYHRVTITNDDVESVNFAL